MFTRFLWLALVFLLVPGYAQSQEVDAETQKKIQACKAKYARLRSDAAVELSQLDFKKFSPKNINFLKDFTTQFKDLESFEKFHQLYDGKKGFEKSIEEALGILAAAKNQEKSKSRSNRAVAVTDAKIAAANGSLVMIYRTEIKRRADKRRANLAYYSDPDRVAVWKKDHASLMARCDKYKKEYQASLKAFSKSYVSFRKKHDNMVFSLSERSEIKHILNGGDVKPLPSSEKDYLRERDLFTHKMNNIMSQAAKLHRTSYPNSLNDGEIWEVLGVNREDVLSGVEERRKPFNFIELKKRISQYKTLQKEFRRKFKGPKEIKLLVDKIYRARIIQDQAELYYKEMYQKPIVTKRDLVARENFKKKIRKKRLEAINANNTVHYHIGKVLEPKYQKEFLELVKDKGWEKFNETWFSGWEKKWKGIKKPRKVKKLPPNKHRIG